MNALADLLAALSAPAAFPEEAWGPGVRQVEVVQTHISVVFLTTLRAYKLKKPLSLWGLVDYSTREGRLHWCEEEVRLNRRLAEDVYLGVVPIVKRGGRLVVGEVAGAPGAAREQAVEHAVCMRRFRPEDTLERRVAERTAEPETLARLGQTLAAFHARQRLQGREQKALRLGLYAGVLTQNVRSTRELVPSLFPAGLHAALERLLVGGLLRHRAALRARLARGLGVDGHGDVRLEHVLVESERLSVIDCVEFTTRLRHIDPLSDAAFLWMELLSRGRRDLGAAFLTGYGVAPEETALLHHFAAYRAHVRAKVDATVAGEAEVPAAQREAARARACGHLALSWTLARRGVEPAPLVILRGPSGSGKSVLASKLAPWLDAEVVRSDHVRKELFGLAPLQRPTAAMVATLYGPEAGARTYAEVLRRGLKVVAEGRAAFLDATYLLEGSRRTVFDAAARAGVPCLLVDLRITPELARERLRARSQRGDDASDADVAVYEEQVRTAEPLKERELSRSLPHEAQDDPLRLLLPLCEAVERASPATPEPTPQPIHKDRDPRPGTG